MKQICDKHPGVKIEYDFDMSSSGYLECPLCLALSENEEVERKRKSSELKDSLEICKLHSSLMKIKSDLDCQIDAINKRKEELDESIDSFLERVRQLDGVMAY